MTIGTAAAVAGADFHTGDEINAATWAGGSGANEFAWNNTIKELWYSANGTGSDNPRAREHRGVDRSRRPHVLA